MGIPVALSLNKKGSHQTFGGGCCSLIAIVFLLGVFLYLGEHGIFPTKVLADKLDRLCEVHR